MTKRATHSKEDLEAHWAEKSPAPDFTTLTLKGPWAVYGAPCYSGYKVVDVTGRSVAAFPSNGTRDNAEKVAIAQTVAAAPELRRLLGIFVAHVEPSSRIRATDVAAARDLLKSLGGAS